MHSGHVATVLMFKLFQLAACYLCVLVAYRVLVFIHSIMNLEALRAIYQIDHANNGV